MVFRKSVGCFLSNLFTVNQPSDDLPARESVSRGVEGHGEGQFQNQMSVRPPSAGESSASSSTASKDLQESFASHESGLTSTASCQNMPRTDSQMTMMTMLTVRTDFASLHEFPVGWEERVHATLATKLALHARKFDFCFLLISSSLGFGNMYRFPSLILKYGATFFIPYMVALAVCAFPVTLLELTIGQYSGLGPARSCREVAPAFAGLGISNVLTSGFCAIYYGVTLSWVLFYTYHSFYTPLPWLTCSNPWNTIDCFSRTDDHKCRSVNRTYNLGACQTFPDFCSTRRQADHKFVWVPGYDRHCRNTSNDELVPFSVLRSNVTLPSNEFFKRGMLQHYFQVNTQATLTRLGHLATPVLACNAVSWLLTFAYIVVYKNSTNKAFVTSCLSGGTVFKSVIILILFLRAVTLPHAREGLLVFKDADWGAHLGDWNLWYDSVTHTIYCTGVGFGSLFTFAASNEFNHGFVWDSVGLCFTNAAVSTLMSVILYSYVGHLENNADIAAGGALTSVTVNRVIKYGFGLIFSTYPEAMDATPVPNLWAILLFSMLTLISLESQCGMVKVVLLAIEAESPETFSSSSALSRAALTLGVCLLGFTLSVPLCSQGGIYLIILMIDFSAVFPLMVVCLLNVVLFIFVYGRGRMQQHFQQMQRPGPVMRTYLRVTWLFAVPVILMVCTAISLVDLGKPADIVFKDSPLTAYLFGWTYMLCHLIPIPIMFVVSIIRNLRAGQDLKVSFTPTETWKQTCTSRATKARHHQEDLAMSKFQSHLIPLPAVNKLHHGGPHRLTSSTHDHLTVVHVPATWVAARAAATAALATGLPSACFRQVSEFGAQADLGSLVSGSMFSLNCVDSELVVDGGGAERQQQEGEEGLVKRVSLPTSASRDLIKPYTTTTTTPRWDDV